MLDFYDNYIRLRLEGVTRGVSLRDAYIAALRSVERDESVPLLIDEKSYALVCRALREKDYACSHLMLALAAQAGLPLAGVRVACPNDITMSAFVDFGTDGNITSVPAPVGEALVTALEGRCGIYVETHDYHGQKPSANNMALPLRAMSDKLLNEAIEGAVKADDFELASVLRDELRKRQRAHTAPMADNHPEA